VNIGSHPIEVYFQSNPYQDMMSVGCYDVINDRWLVGPDLKNKDFDPYSEYYGDDMEYVKDVIGDIRNIILECYESAIAIQNARKQEFKDFEMQHLRNGIERAAAIFTNARQFRKVSSSPTDEKSAKTNRDSRKWKIADSAFKLLDKFGYLAILRTMTQCFEKAQTGEITNDEIVSQVVNSIRDNLANNANLDEEQKNMFCEMCGQVEEGLGKTLGMFALMAAMFGLPGEASAKEIEKHGKNIPQQVVDGVKDVDVNKDFGGLSYVKLVNLVATIIYNEAMIDYQKTKNDNCLIAIANVI